MKPKAVLAYCREKGIRSFDLRYPDLHGDWRHVTLPVSSLSEETFESGYGQEVVLDATASNLPYALLVPHSHANYLDPFTEQPSLVLIASVQDIVQREDHPFDSRAVAAQALRYLQSTAIADDVRVRTSLRFQGSSASNSVAGASKQLHLGLDEQYLFRCRIADRAVDAGVNVERHLRNASGTSEITLKSSSLLEGCDDWMMLKYLVAQVACQENVEPEFSMNWLASQWSFVRNGESVFAGGSYHGLSDAGVYAQGGLIAHAPILSSIYLLSHLREAAVLYPFEAGADLESSRSFSRTVYDSTNPRELVVELRAVPAATNVYLAYAATAMAMIDGIQNKILPPKNSSANGLPLISTGELHWNRDLSLEALDTDWDFLVRGDVFSEELLEWIRTQVRS